MQSETIRSHWPAHSLGLMSFLAALVMANEAGAGGLFPGQGLLNAISLGEGDRERSLAPRTP
jgi:hypothetical protein